MSDEFYFLAACSAGQGPGADLIVNDLGSRNLDWDRLVGLARRHRVTGLFVDGLNRHNVAAPKTHVVALKWAAQRGALAELALVGELKRVLDILDTASIRPRVLKGPAVSLIAYGRFGLRCNRDIDLLVGESERSASLRLLLESGYEIYETGLSADQPLSDEWLANHKDINLRHAANGVIIELHWRLFGSAYLSSRFSGDRAILTGPGGIEIATLSEDDNLTFLCVHGAQHAWSRLKWLLDVHALAKRMSIDELDALYRSAKVRGLHRPVAQALLLSEKLLGSTIPGTVKSDGASDWRTKALVYIAGRSLMDSGLAEIEDVRFGSTLKNCSQYLIVRSREYVIERLRFDVGQRPDAAPDARRRSLPVQIAARLFDWLGRNLRRPSARVGRSASKEHIAVHAPRADSPPKH